MQRNVSTSLFAKASVLRDMFIVKNNTSRLLFVFYPHVARKWRFCWQINGFQYPVSVPQRRSTEDEGKPSTAHAHFWRWKRNPYPTFANRTIPQPAVETRHYWREWGGCCTTWETGVTRTGAQRGGLPGVARTEGLTCSPVTPVFTRALVFTVTTADSHQQRQHPKALQCFRERLRCALEDRFTNRPLKNNQLQFANSNVLLPIYRVGVKGRRLLCRWFTEAHIFNIANTGFYKLGIQMRSAFCIS
jgi:hypothetical protein